MAVATMPFAPGMRVRVLANYAGVLNRGATLTVTACRPGEQPNTIRVDFAEVTPCWFDVPGFQTFLAPAGPAAPAAPPEPGDFVLCPARRAGVEYEVVAVATNGGDHPTYACTHVLTLRGPDGITDLEPAWYWPGYPSSVMSIARRRGEPASTPPAAPPAGAREYRTLGNGESWPVPLPGDRLVIDPAMRTALGLDNADGPLTVRDFRPESPAACAPNEMGVVSFHDATLRTPASGRYWTLWYPAGAATVEGHPVRLPDPATIRHGARALLAPGNLVTALRPLRWGGRPAGALPERCRVGDVARVTEVHPDDTGGRATRTQGPRFRVEGESSLNHATGPDAWWDLDGVYVTRNDAPDAQPSPRRLPPPKYANLVLLVPTVAKRTVLQLAPVLRLTTAVPARRLERARVYHAGFDTETTIDVPPVAWVSTLATQSGRLVTNDHKLYATHDAPGWPLAPYLLSNCWAENGNICWGTRNGTPPNLRQAHSVFFTAPFNSDLWRHRSDPHECPPDAPRPTNAHTCPRRTSALPLENVGDWNGAARLYCPPVHRCRDGRHVRLEYNPVTGNDEPVALPDGHVHTCATFRAGNRCQLAHQYTVPPRNLDGRYVLSLTAMRERLKRRHLHCDPELLRRFKVTLQRVFNQTANALTCPCNCCAGQCSCYVACTCCRTVGLSCNCTRCPCAPRGGCGCVRTCACCDGRCGHQPAACRCNLALDYARWLVAYRPAELENKTTFVRGTRYVESSERHDAMFLSSDPAVLARVPAALHVRDATEVPCVAGPARRTPDGAYRVTFGPDCTIEFKREEITL